jgi:hypothetical protein
VQSKEKRAQDHKVQKGMEEANKRNETRKFYTVVHGMKANYQPQVSICKDGDNNSIGNDQLIMKRRSNTSRT